MKDRVILHVDLNGFFASVECFHNPMIRNQPVAVCGDADARHGIILAKNEIAKRYNIRTGQVIWQAKKLCPTLVTVKASFRQYVRFSQLAKRIYRRYTDRVESFGIDECWLDVTGMDGKVVADELRNTIREELGITASVGVSWNKIFAKLGSDMKKPDATTVISRENYKQTIFHLPVQDLLLVGKATKEKLNRLNIFTIGDLATTNGVLLRHHLGKWGDYLLVFSNGLDNAPVALYDEFVTEKSVGNSTTALRDLKTLDDVKMIISVIAESVASRLRASFLKGCVIHLSIRDCELNVWGKQITLPYNTFLSKDIIDAATMLFVNYYDFSKPIRSLGIKVARLCAASAPYQTDIFLTDEERNKKERLELVKDEIRERFGSFALRRAVELLDKDLTGFSPKDDHTIHPVSYF